MIAFIQVLYDPHTALPPPDDSQYYQQVQEDIAFFGVSSQVYFILRKKGLLERLPLTLQAYLKQSYTEVLYRNLFIEKQLKQIVEWFESQGIEAIPLKGIHFAERYYGHVGARGTSDIDILVKGKDLERAIQSVKHLGFTTEGELLPSHFHRSFSKRLPNSPLPLTVELHWDLLKDNTSSLDIGEFWAEAKRWKNYSYIQELSDYHTFYMIALHGWRHNMNSMKYFLDMLQLIHTLQDQLDYSRLYRNAAGHKTFRRITWTLQLLYHQFPHLERMKKLELPRKKNIYWDYEALRHSHTRGLRHYWSLLHSQYLIFDSLKHMIIPLKSWLLPAPVELDFELAPGGKRKPLPLPIRYIQLYAQRCGHALQTLFRLRSS